MVLKDAPYPLASTLGLTINSTQLLERYLENINKIMPFSAENTPGTSRSSKVKSKPKWPKHLHDLAPPHPAILCCATFLIYTTYTPIVLVAYVCLKHQVLSPLRPSKCYLPWLVCFFAPTPSHAHSLCIPHVSVQMSTPPRLSWHRT